MANTAYKVLILGGGAGGISVAARLRKQMPEGSIAIVEPSEKHYYQPLWTLIGAGLFEKEESQKDEADLIPEGVEWIKQRVASIDPQNQSVKMWSGQIIEYDFLVVATGLKLNWDQIPGMEGQLGNNGICSIYEFNNLEYTFETINNFKSGKAVFIMPPTPIKCAGAPQKIMYLADDIFRRKGVRDNVEIVFATSGKACFGIPVFANALAEIVKEKNIHTAFAHKIKSVDAVNKTVTFDLLDANNHPVGEESIKFDMLHIVPTMSAHNFIADSGLAFTEGDQKGWLAVDKHTLQHLKYKNIFGVGDVTGVPNSKTGAAIRKQYPVVVKNLISAMHGVEPQAQYDGYSSCPLVTEIGKVMLAEFGYDSKLMPTFPLDPAIPRRSYWYLKKDFLPLMYWHGMLRGLM